MKILKVTEIGTKADLIEQPAPQASEKEALVKVHYSGVSIGTEMWVATGKRLENRTVPFPAAGYQVTGEIVELSSKAGIPARSRSTSPSHTANRCSASSRRLSVNGPIARRCFA